MDADADPLLHEPDGSALIAAATVRRVCGSGSNAVVLLCSFPQLRDDVWGADEDEVKDPGVEYGDRIPRGRKIAVKISSHFWDTNAKRLLDCERTTLHHLPEHPNVIRVWSRFKAAIPQHFVQYLTPDMATAAADVDAGYTTQVFCMDYHPLTLDSFRAVLPTPMPWHFLWRIARDLITVTVHMERHGVAHLDLKLDNILVAYDGRCVLTDFGISRIFPSAAMTLEYAQPFDLLMNRLVLSPEVLLCHDEAKRRWDAAGSAEAAAALEGDGGEDTIDTPLRRSVLLHRGQASWRVGGHGHGHGHAHGAGSAYSSSSSAAAGAGSRQPFPPPRKPGAASSGAHSAGSGTAPGSASHAHHVTAHSLPFANQNVWAVGIALYELAAGFMHEPSYPEPGGGVMGGLYGLSTIPPLPVPALRRHAYGAALALAAAAGNGAGTAGSGAVSARPRGLTAPAALSMVGSGSGMSAGPSSRNISGSSASPPLLSTGNSGDPAQAISAGFSSLPPALQPTFGFRADANGWLHYEPPPSSSEGRAVWEARAAAAAAAYAAGADAAGAAAAAVAAGAQAAAAFAAASGACSPRPPASPDGSGIPTGLGPGAAFAASAVAGAVAGAIGAAAAAPPRVPVTGACYPREFAALVLSMLHADPQQRIGAVEALAAIERLRPKYADVCPGPHAPPPPGSVAAPFASAGDASSGAAAGSSTMPGTPTGLRRMTLSPAGVDPAAAAAAAVAAAASTGAGAMPLSPAGPPAAAAAPGDGPAGTAPAAATAGSVGGAGVFIEVQVAPETWLPLRVDAPDVVIAVSGDAYTTRPASMADLESHAIMPLLLRHSSGVSRLMLIDSALSVETAVTAWSLCPRAVHILPPDRQVTLQTGNGTPAGSGVGAAGAAGIASGAAAGPAKEGSSPFWGAYNGSGLHRSSSMRSGGGRQSRAASGSFASGSGSGSGSGAAGGSGGGSGSARKSVRSLTGATGPSRGRAAPHPPANAAAAASTSAGTPLSRASKAFLGGNPRHRHLLDEAGAAAAAAGSGSGSGSGAAGDSGNADGSQSPGRAGNGGGGSSDRDRDGAFGGFGGAKSPLSPAMRATAFTGAGSKPAPPAGAGLPPPANVRPAARFLAAARERHGEKEVGEGAGAAVGSAYSSAPAVIGAGAGDDALARRPSVAALLAKFQQPQAGDSSSGSSAGSAPRRPSLLVAGRAGDAAGASAEGINPLRRVGGVAAAPVQSRRLSGAGGGTAPLQGRSAPSSAGASTIGGAAGSGARAFRPSLQGLSGDAAAAAAATAAAGDSATSASGGTAAAKALAASSSTGDDEALELTALEGGDGDGGSDDDAAHAHAHGIASEDDDIEGEGHDADDASDSDAQGAGSGSDGESDDDGDDNDHDHDDEALRQALEDASCFDHYPHLTARTGIGAAGGMSGAGGAVWSERASPVLMPAPTPTDATASAFGADGAGLGPAALSARLASPSGSGVALVSAAATLGSPSGGAGGAGGSGGNGMSFFFPPADGVAGMTGIASSSSSAALLRDDDALADAVLSCRLYAGGCEINKAAAIRSIMTYFPESDPWAAAYTLQQVPPTPAGASASTAGTDPAGQPWPRNPPIVARIHAVVLDLIPPAVDTLAASADYFLQLAADACSFTTRCEAAAVAVAAGGGGAADGSATVSLADGFGDIIVSGRASAVSPAMWALDGGAAAARRRSEAPGSASAAGSRPSSVNLSAIQTSSSRPLSAASGSSFDSREGSGGAAGPFAHVDALLARPLAGPWAAPQLALPAELRDPKTNRLGVQLLPSASSGACPPLVGEGAAGLGISVPADFAAGLLHWLRHRTDGRRKDALPALALALATAPQPMGRAPPAPPTPLALVPQAAPGTQTRHPHSHGHHHHHHHHGHKPSTVADCIRSLPQLAAYMEHAVLYRCLLALTGLCNSALREGAPGGFPFVACAAAIAATQGAGTRRHETASAAVGLLRNISCTDNHDTARRIVSAGAIDAVCGLFFGPWDAPHTLQQSLAQLAPPGPDVLAMEAAATATAAHAAGAPSSSAAGSRDASRSPAPGAAPAAATAAAVVPARGPVVSEDGRRRFSAVSARIHGGGAPTASTSTANPLGAAADRSTAASAQAAAASAAAASAAASQQDAAAADSPASLAVEPPPASGRIHGDDARLAEDCLLAISNLVRFDEMQTAALPVPAIARVVAESLTRHATVASLCDAGVRLLRYLLGIVPQEPPALAMGAAGVMQPLVGCIAAHGGERSLLEGAMHVLCSLLVHDGNRTADACPVREAAEAVVGAMSRPEHAEDADVQALAATILRNLACVAEAAPTAAAATAPVAIAAAAGNAAASADGSGASASLTAALRGAASAADATSAGGDGGTVSPLHHHFTPPAIVSDYLRATFGPVAGGAGIGGGVGGARIGPGSIALGIGTGTGIGIGADGTMGAGAPSDGPAGDQPPAGSSGFGWEQPLAAPHSSSNNSSASSSSSRGGPRELTVVAVAAAAGAGANVAAAADGAAGGRGSTAADTHSVSAAASLARPYERLQLSAATLVAQSGAAAALESAMASHPSVASVQDNARCAMYNLLLLSSGDAVRLLAAVRAADERAAAAQRAAQSLLRIATGDLVVAAGANGSLAIVPAAATAGSSSGNGLRMQLLQRDASACSDGSAGSGHSDGSSPFTLPAPAGAGNASAANANANGSGSGSTAAGEEAGSRASMRQGLSRGAAGGLGVASRALLPNAKPAGDAGGQAAGSQADAPLTALGMMSASGSGTLQQHQHQQQQQRAGASTAATLSTTTSTAAHDFVSVAVVTPPPTAGGASTTSADAIRQRSAASTAATATSGSGSQAANDSSTIPHSQHSASPSDSSSLRRQLTPAFWLMAVLFLAALIAAIVGFTRA